jgi:hypothetical protein|tara:strand:+ start:808 stop:1053 length:246 start_codon:yes stop_codon:yes gene_type:complete
MHPLTPNLHEMSDTELQEKMKELNTRLVQAYRASPGVVNQIRMVMEDFTEEQQRRDKKSLDKLMDDSSNKQDGWDDIIDIG